MEQIPFDLTKITGEHLEDYFLLGISDSSREKAQILTRLLTVCVGADAIKRVALLSPEGRDLMQRFSNALKELSNPNS